jgi:spore coat protein A
MPTRRSFPKLTGATTAAWYVATQTGWMERAVAQIPGGTLDPNDVTKYVTPMLIPPVMPRAATITMPGGKPADYYEISMRQLSQQILPAGMPATTVWGYGAVTKSVTSRGLLLHHAPSLTIETTWKRPVRIKWINELKDGNGDFLPHLLPVDPRCTGPTRPAARRAATCGRRLPPRPAATPARCRS